MNIVQDSCGCFWIWKDNLQPTVYYFPLYCNYDNNFQIYNFITPNK